MKFSTCFTTALFLSGIIASPISTPDSVENGTSTVHQASKFPYLCFDQNKSSFCKDGSYRKCTEYYRDHTDADSIYGGKYCGFWCNEIKNVNDCKSIKKLYDFHPNFACDDAQYC
ncbi:putative secreted protein [Wickerhamomyces ciferrii]|uniref:Secreted protein n=1 Tax=Wickerhamomyces ciferrii (strain ATCC 14091 / BCRC 22168 / CBS 111 / JCM 3599 / NBRC 0793 / NRRL Y-1031 F-60-10) TaxID=1206466 RepID=K0L0Q0_WICCF|nr:uncharacterized protein BN7_6637 [Wickerhamomyces ciferrii]CCH47028.1 putative secreted protein [Wickerhamomyces ciferrii]